MLRLGGGAAYGRCWPAGEGVATSLVLPWCHLVILFCRHDVSKKWPAFVVSWPVQGQSGPVESSLHTPGLGLARRSLLPNLHMSEL